MNDFMLLVTKLSIIILMWEDEFFIGFKDMLNKPVKIIILWKFVITDSVMMDSHF